MLTMETRDSYILNERLLICKWQFQSEFYFVDLDQRQLKREWDGKKEDIWSRCHKRSILVVIIEHWE